MYTILAVFLSNAETHSKNLIKGGDAAFSETDKK